MKRLANTGFWSTLVLLTLLLPSACKKQGSGLEASGFLESNGFFIINEGTFRSGNSSLSFYSYDSMKIYNNIFYEVNNRPLGDVANSAIINKGSLYVVVNNSGKLEKTDSHSLKSISLMDGINSPRHMQIIGDDKAYITSLFSDSIVIIDPDLMIVIDYINIGRSSEQISLYEDFAYVSNWAGGNTLTVIDTRTDEIVKTYDLGIDPGKALVDKNGFLWVLCNGGYANLEYPVLDRIDPRGLSPDLSFQFSSVTDSPSSLCINGTGDTLYYLNHDIYRFPVDGLSLPEVPVIDAGNHYFYTIAFDPYNNTLLASDAVDYMQRGWIYGFTADGEELFSVLAGIIPGSFCFKDF
jgi:DNA-binding beta-propeller fold protein YncE